MPQEFVLLSTAAAVGFFHTISGPDHYLPFAVLAKARRWSHNKTTGVILLCGLGHLGSSLLIVLLVLIAGLGLNLITAIDSVRGEIAAGLLMFFGLTYSLWGVYTLYGRNFPEKRHGIESLSPAVLFIIFIFGPCEALIPMIIYPGAEQNYLLAAGTGLIFSIATLFTMLFAVFSTIKGISFLPADKLSRYSHIATGTIIFLCGFLILFAGL